MTFTFKASGADNEDRKDKDAPQEKRAIVNTTTVSYEDKAGTKYSHTSVHKVGEEESERQS